MSNDPMMACVRLVMGLLCLSMAWPVSRPGRRPTSWQMLGVGVGYLLAAADGFGWIRVPRAVWGLFLILGAWMIGDWYLERRRSKSAAAAAREQRGPARRLEPADSGGREGDA